MSEKVEKRDESDDLSRAWAVYAVKAVASEENGIKNNVPWPELSSSDVAAYHANLAKNIESHILLWPTPILVSQEGVDDILVFRENGKLVRIYPPFPVNERTETSGAFEDVAVPEGLTKVARTVALPPSAVRGVRMEHGVGKGLQWSRAFRIDVENGANGLPTLTLLLDHIAQFTHQWWIRSSHNPMLGPFRMGGTITKDYRIIPELKYRGAGTVESTWYGAVEHQPILGFGSPLDRGKWLISAHHTQEGRDADQGLVAFYDGMAAFMSGHDQQAILNLCIATEILLSKHSLAVLDRSPPKLEKAVRDTRLVDEATKKTLSDLVRDRNCVAHGREPKLVRDGKTTVKGYVQAVRRLIGGYLAALPQGGWPEVMTLKLDNGKIFRKV
ncbi:hypothetical protein [Shumkonia mesophila]|uniref:hypothetical protein n=1 Tax=Shumkonia mesophila TaxID=2838854 RepID=UPI002934C224|nr:hypothetical protein [Shumkonia mesophila]